MRGVTARVLARIRARASAGVALATKDDVDVNDLIRRADIAMYQAKARHDGCPVLYAEGWATPARA